MEIGEHEIQQLHRKGNETRERGSACLSVIQSEAKQGNLGAASGSRQLRQPFLSLKVKVAGTAFTGFPWRRTEGWEVEENEFRQWI